MNLLCHASGHVAAPLVLENQGFLFSRCQRCRHDLIRSAPSVVGSAGDSWTGVPEGLRVAWRSADVSAFDQPSWVRQSLRRMRERGQQSATAVSDAAQVALAVVGWHASDAARRAKDTTLAAYRSGRRVIRLPRPARPPHAGIVIINLTMNRDPSWQDAVRADTQFGDMIGA
ncbi:hypothetical protein C8J46_102123 [Sphingomonas sp. PP-F2F-A104-K0414]|uniref:hypothetical protein n=1 Tax=Sphingomonas sp. PP-F2F-A104-K0414 TaxID=2135661 RepID=UPI0010454D2B|nr:hypothetical protein [Sphingomonas sp. PP-F2F-A104-K0414]TCP99982.1 hypothetical protein C8J46_102123 [Sphingomonas sp. PP-F2F-A104-K0414]